jgi:cytoskeletal protein RodZ
MTPHRRSILLVGVIAALAIAIPVMGADPPPSAGPSASVDASPSGAPSGSPEASSSTAPSDSATPSAESAQPGATPETVTAPRPDKTPDPASDSEKQKGPKGDKESEVPVTVTGVVKQAADGQGRPSFTLTAGATTWELSAGPPWYWGDKNPLAAYVGKSVTVAGEAEQGGTELDVDTVDGKAIRAPGKPPWAGGPWVVGPTHPGWKSWMANGKPGKGHDKDGAEAPEASPGS